MSGSRSFEVSQDIYFFEEFVQEVGLLLFAQFFPGFGKGLIAIFPELLYRLVEIDSVGHGVGVIAFVNYALSFRQ